MSGIFRSTVALGVILLATMIGVSATIWAQSAAMRPTGNSTPAVQGATTRSATRPSAVRKVVDDMSMTAKAPIMFDTLEWGWNHAQVKSRMDELKMDLLEEQTKASIYFDLYFKGMYQGEKTVVVAAFNRQGQLVEIMVTKEPLKLNALMERFYQVQDAFVQTYGSPATHYQRYFHPFFKGDKRGDEAAIRTHHLIVCSLWYHEGGTSLSLAISPFMELYIYYRSPLAQEDDEWRKENNARTGWQAPPFPAW